MASYVYTPSDQRVIKKVDNGPTTFYPTRSYETDGTTTTIRLFLGSQEVGTVEKVSGSPAALRFIHPDNLGGTRVVTDASGNEVQTLYYQPFGEIRVNNQVGTYNEKRKFTGHFHDDETSLEYMEARYYTAGWGRFMAEDPVFVAIGSSAVTGAALSKLLADPQSLNSYAYARNNPLRYTDPDGRDAVADLTIIGGLSLMDGPLPVGDVLAVGYGIFAIARDIFKPPVSPTPDIGISSPAISTKDLNIAKQARFALPPDVGVQAVLCKWVGHRFGIIG